MSIDSYVLEALAFCLGLFAAALGLGLTLKNTASLFLIGLAAGAAGPPLFCLDGRIEYSHELHLKLGLLIAAGVFVVLANARFREKILPTVNEAVVFWLTLCLLAFLHNSGHRLAPALLLLSLPGAALAVLSALTPLNLGRPLRFLLALWYTLVCCFFGLYQAYRILFIADTAGALKYLEIFLLAGSIIVLAGHLGVLLEFNGGGEEDWRETARRWKDHYYRIAARLSTRQLQLPYAALIVAAQVLLLWLSRHFAHHTGGIVLSLSVLMTPIAAGLGASGEERGTGEPRE